MSALDETPRSQVLGFVKATHTFTSLQLTRQLLNKGNSVVATARAPAKAAELQQLASEHESKLSITALDVSEPQSIEVHPSSMPVLFANY